MTRLLPAVTALALCGALAACGGGGEKGGGGGGGKALVRPAAQDLTAAERKTFTDAILKLKEMPSPFRGYAGLSYYDTFVKWHKDAFNCDEQTAHMGPNFLPWHRHFLTLFEEGLAKAAGEPVAIPYWDWTDPESTNAVFRDDFMGGNGDVEKGYALTSGPFRRGEYRLNVVDPKANDPLGLRYLVRQIGTFPSNLTLPTAEDVSGALARTELRRRPVQRPVRPRPELPQQPRGLARPDRPAVRGRPAGAAHGSRSGGEEARPPQRRPPLGRRDRGRPPGDDGPEHLAQRPGLLAAPLEHRSHLAGLDRGERRAVPAGERLAQAGREPEPAR